MEGADDRVIGDALEHLAQEHADELRQLLTYESDSAGGVMADSGWYYVRSRWEHIGARAPKEVDRQVVAISFDQSGKVSNIERFGLEKGQVVPLSRRVTETNVRGLSFIRRLLGAVGRIDPTQFLSRNRE